MILSEIESPRPVPFFLYVVNGSKMELRCSLEIPHPLSWTWMMMESLDCSAVMEMVPSGEAASAAFLKRFKNTSCNFVLSPVIWLIEESILEKYSNFVSATDAAKEREIYSQNGRKENVEKLRAPAWLNRERSSKSTDINSTSCISSCQWSNVLASGCLDSMSWRVLYIIVSGFRSSCEILLMTNCSSLFSCIDCTAFHMKV